MNNALIENLEECNKEYIDQNIDLIFSNMEFF